MIFLIDLESIQLKLSSDYTVIRLFDDAHFLGLIL